MRGEKLMNRLTIVCKVAKNNRRQIDARNVALAHRFYWYTEIKRYRYDYTIVKLADDFYLSESRVIVLLVELQPQLDKLFAEQPTIRTLNRLFPQFRF